MTISTAHLRELARKASEDRLDGEDWIGGDTDLACVIPSFANLIAACTPESIAALCDRADEAATLRTLLTDARAYVADCKGDGAAVMLMNIDAALSKGGE